MYFFLSFFCSFDFTPFPVLFFFSYALEKSLPALRTKTILKTRSCLIIPRRSRVEFTKSSTFSSPIFFSFTPTFVFVSSRRGVSRNSRPNNLFSPPIKYSRRCTRAQRRKAVNYNGAPDWTRKTSSPRNRSGVQQIQLPVNSTAAIGRDEIPIFR